MCFGNIDEASQIWFSSGVVKNLFWRSLCILVPAVIGIILCNLFTVTRIPSGEYGLEFLQAPCCETACAEISGLVEWGSGNRNEKFSMGDYIIALSGSMGWRITSVRSSWLGMWRTDSRSLVDQN